MLNVLVTSSWLGGEVAQVLAGFDVTHTQYNVLRILRGSHPEPLTCSAIGSRLVERTPDVTRLLDRLERADLLQRRRAEHDRRVVEVGITPKGMALLERIDPQIAGLQEKLGEVMTPQEFETLNALLEKLRTLEMSSEMVCGG